MTWTVETMTAVRGETAVCGVGRTILVYDAFWRFDPEPQYFLWGCPICGNTWSGWFAGEKPPPADWTAWTLSGSREKPSLNPSLVCAGARLPMACPGHFWMNQGVLISV